MIKIKTSFFSKIILLLSAGFIFFLYPFVPKHLAIDEVEFTKLALFLEGKPYTPYSPLATGHSTLYFYFLLLTLKIFGINPFALRLVSAISGVLSGLLFFWVMQYALKNKFFAFLSAFILISSRWFINFARFSFEPTFLLFLELSSIYFFFQYLKKQKIYQLIMTSIFAGLAFNSYTPGRIFFLLPLFFLISQLINSLTHKQNKKLLIKHLLYFLIPFVILISPLQLYLFNHQDIRVNQLLFLSNPELSNQQKTDFFIQNISKTVMMFFTNGDPNGKHNYPYKPALNSILGLFFISGLLIAIKSFKKFENRFFFFYLILSLIPTLLVYPWENPSMLRTYTALPSIVYFLGNAIVIFHQIINKIKNRKVFRYLILTTFYLLLILSSFYELRTYFFYQSKVFDHAFEIKKPLQKVINCPNILECKD